MSLWQRMWSRERVIIRTRFGYLTQRPRFGTFLEWYVPAQWGARDAAVRLTRRQARRVLDVWEWPEAAIETEARA